MIAVLPHTGHRVRPGQASEHLAAWAAGLAYAVTAPVRNLLITAWARQLRRAATEPRPAAIPPAAAPEGTAPSPLGAVPLDYPAEDPVPAGLWPAWDDGTWAPEPIGAGEHAVIGPDGEISIRATWDQQRWDHTAPLPMARPYAPKAGYR